MTPHHVAIPGLPKMKAELECMEALGVTIVIPKQNGEVHSFHELEYSPSSWMLSMASGKFHWL